MHQKEVYSEPGGIGIVGDWQGPKEWYDTFDESYHPSDDGYGADSEDSDIESVTVDEDTFPYPWLSKLVVTHNLSPVAVIHKKPVEKIVTYLGQPVAVFYHRYSAIIGDSTGHCGNQTASMRTKKTLLLTETTSSFSPSPADYSGYFTPETDHREVIKIDDTLGSIHTETDHREVIRIEDTLDSIQDYSSPRPVEDSYLKEEQDYLDTPAAPLPTSPYVTGFSEDEEEAFEQRSEVVPFQPSQDVPFEPSQDVPFEHPQNSDNEEHHENGSNGSHGSHDEYAESIISLSSDDSVIILSSDDDESDCDSIISLSSTESDSVIYVGSATLKRPRAEPKTSKPTRKEKKARKEGKEPRFEPIRIKYDPALDESILVHYPTLTPDTDVSYYAVKISKHPGVFTDFNVALNHANRPGDVITFMQLRGAANYLKKRPKFFESTQRQHQNKWGKPVYEVFSDGSSKIDADGKQWGGFGVWFGHYHPDNVAGPLVGDMQDPLQGELRGLLEAFKVLYNRHDDNRYTIYCDCYAVVKKLNEGKNFPRKYHTIVTSIGLYKRLLGYRVQLQHIVGHCGHPGNERADILAKMGRVRRDGPISCLNAIMEDRYRRTIGEDEVYPFNGRKLDDWLDKPIVKDKGLEKG
ncbi:hypothetical protein CJU90_5746 [Yarrowia sp. C11]|nr:hypothetical protein CJU90_5746 [Yarrowia sp. C11]KAG5364327.1 hypothetical protein CKK34_3124 [Yarrowia sp. E02]